MCQNSSNLTYAITFKITKDIDWFQITESRQRGDMYDVAKYGGQLSEFMKENKINPLNSVFPMLVQFPIFISMFLGLRDMANLRSLQRAPDEFWGSMPEEHSGHSSSWSGYTCPHVGQIVVSLPVRV